MFLSWRRKINPSDDSLLSFKRGFSRDVIPFDLGSNIFDHAAYENLRNATKSVEV